MVRKSFVFVYPTIIKAYTNITRAPDKVHIFISKMPIAWPNPMFDHLLESSHRDDSYKWSNLGFGQEITELASIKVNFTHLIWSCEYWRWKSLLTAMQMLFQIDLDAGPGLRCLCYLAEAVLWQRCSVESTRNSRAKQVLLGCRGRHSATADEWLQPKMVARDLKE